MNKSDKTYTDLIGESYKNYLTMTEPTFTGKNISLPEYIYWIKTDEKYSEKWGLKIEERELSREERSEYYYKHGNSEGIVEGSLDRPTFEENDVAHIWYDERNVPTRAITITYNNKTIESYE
jgi:hypothetical protein